MRKGMSQVLALIVAAAVLMMAALSVIFITQGSLTNLFSSSQAQQCNSAVETQCEIARQSAGDDDVTIEAPNACFDSDGNQVNNVNLDASGSGSDVGPGDEINCP